MRSQRSNQRILIFTDADNTLWDTDAVYADAQLNLLKDVESATGIFGPSQKRLDFVREYDQEIAARHHKRLRYPARLLAHAVALGLRGNNPHNAAKIACLGQCQKSKLSAEEAKAIAQRFLEGLRIRPKLRPGVREALVEFASRGYTTVVVTEGAKSECHDQLRHYDLQNLIERVIESPKHPDLYRRVRKLGGGGADISVMIGDQLDRDILPAKKAGLVTIFFPGGFKPKWSPVPEEQHAEDYQIASLEEAVDIVAGIERKESRVSKAI